jgi:hypothetical protein
MDKYSSLIYPLGSVIKKRFKCLVVTEVEECLVGPTEYQTNELNSGSVNIQHALWSVIISSTNILPTVILSGVISSEAIFLVMFNLSMNEL